MGIMCTLKTFWIWTPTAHLYLSVGAPEVPPPLQLDRLQGFLRHFPDPQFGAYHAHGLSGGFRLGFSRTTHLQSVYRNHPSSTENQQTTTDHLSSEREAGRIVGPLPSPTWPHIHVSPMGLVPKNHSDRWRLIVDLSSPRGHSVNDGISSDLCSLRYVSLDNATEIVMGLGRSALLIKFNLSNAYRIVPVHPDDQPLLGISWQDEVYMDRSCHLVLGQPPRSSMQSRISSHGSSTTMAFHTSFITWMTSSFLPLRSQAWCQG